MRKNRLKRGDVSATPAAIHNTTGYVPAEQIGVVIIMAAYNGSRFIEEQIRSIQAQSYPAWTLYVRDDGSRDDTIQKVLQIEREDNRVKLVQDEFGNQGAIGNFSTLMKVALEENSEYVFFADQDDVWYPEKLAIMLGAMQELERSYGASIPLLVHCDLAVVNEDLQSIANSFVRLSRLSPTSAELGVLLCQNQVTGCACVINRSLLELALPVPRGVLMHDWWLALLASSVGKIGFIPKQLVKYRQHGGNVLGAMSLGKKIKQLVISPKQWKLRIEIMRCSLVQAAMLEERIKSRVTQLPANILRPIHTYSQILNVANLTRVSKLREQKIEKQSTIAKWTFNFLITCMRKTEVKSVA